MNKFAKITVIIIAIAIAMFFTIKVSAASLDTLNLSLDKETVKPR